MESLKPGHVVLLNAPVGSGKTTLVVKKLWPFIRNAGKKLLLLVNRSALRGQLVQTILGFLGIPLGTPISDETYMEFEGLTLASYQYLEAIFSEHTVTPSVRIGSLSANCFDFVVFDEVHYLLADSTFNSRIGLLWHLPEAFPKAIRLYMSATLAPVRDTIFEIENIVDCWATAKSSADRSLLPCRYVDARATSLLWNQGLPFPRRCSEIIGAKPNFSYFTPVVYDHADDLASLIIDAIKHGDTGKWLVFVKSKKSGVLIRSVLQEAGISCAFVAAKGTPDADEDAVQRLLKYSRFDSQVLLSTNVLDNGISIKDERVTHLVTAGDDEIETVQQAGRIRVKSAKKGSIELWICRYPAKYFSSILFKTRKILERLEMLEKINNSPVYTKATKYQKICDFLIENGSEELAPFLYKSGPDNFSLNRFALRYLAYKICDIEENLRLLRVDPDGYLRKVLGWFCLPDSIPNDITQEKKAAAQADLNRYIAETLEVGVIHETVWDAWRDGFKTHFEAVNGPYCPDHPNRDLGVNAINKCLEFLGTDIVLAHDTKRNLYTFSREGK